MPSIFVRIDASLEDGELPARLAAQGANLSHVATTIAGLIEDPPDSLGDLQRAINELPLPEFEAGGEFAATLDAVRAAVPGDLTSITGGLLAGLQSLGATISREISGPLTEALEAALAVYRLIDLDLTCSDTNGSSATPGAGGAGGTTPADGTGTGGTAGGEAPGPSGVERARTQVDALSGLLDAAPSPFDVVGLLAWLHDATAILRQDGFLSFPLPVVEELIDPLQTLQEWKGMQPEEVRDHISLSIQDLGAFIRNSVSGLLGTLVADISETAAHLHADALAEIPDSLSARLGELRAAVISGDLSGTDAAVAQVNSRVDQYETLRTTLQAELLDDIPDLNRRLISLPVDLADRMDHVLSVLRPGRSLGFLEDLVSAGEPSDSIREEIEAQIRPFAGWIEDLTQQLDLAAIQEPLATVAGAARDSVDGLEQGMAGIAIQTRDLFQQVEMLLDQVDTEELAGQVEGEIQDFADQLNQQILALFQPARAGVAQVLDTIGDGLDDFDPEEVIEALRQAIDALAGVLEDPEVVSTLAEIRNALASATTALDQLSFTPLTDQVITGIEEVKSALQAIDTSQLSPVLQAALQAALAVLPDDLTPLTDPVIEEFDEMVETGPVPLLETVRGQPQRLLERVRGFEPAALIGGALSEPYGQLLSRMEGFEPSRLLDPVEEELERLKERLREEANPGSPIQLLEEPFERLSQSFDRLSPDDLVQPLQQAISGAIDDVIAALPVDEVFEQVDAAVGAAETVETFAESLATLLGKLRDLLQGLAGSRTQVESWIDSILDKVEAIGDTGSLQPAFAGLSSALDETRAAVLLDQYNDAAASLHAVLSTLNPLARLSALVQAHAAFPRAPLAALPDSPEKAALVAALARLNPLDPEFGAPYRELESYRRSLEPDGLNSVMAGWDARYHGPDSLLTGLRVGGATSAELRALIHDALEPQFIGPVQALFAGIEPASGPVEALLSTVQGLVESLQEKLSGILTGPESLAGIRDSLQELVERLRDFDLDFLRASLGDVFDRVRAKLDALDPARLREAVEAAFDSTLETISLGEIFPPEEVAALDEDYGELVGRLRSLDPETLVIEVVQPEYEERMNALIETFDLTPLLTVLIELLRSLDQELKDELERVNLAYQDMLRTAPSMSVGAVLGF